MTATASTATSFTICDGAWRVEWDKATAELHITDTNGDLVEWIYWPAPLTEIEFTRILRDWARFPTIVPGTRWIRRQVLNQLRTNNPQAYADYIAPMRPREISTAGEA